ncbi:metal-sensing transcriptional repressor [Corynebacterium pygosceleis]|uniref:metal-sensing transcriptional repressor n=1 Tax=Corynebacterium pygosceleis TaxID=2800406 RepID=UPI001905041B|nr:metal-sensitive transcriptional regulator [Corynebacterium pygosceleis]MCL0120852.1 metal-sensitive transcriptional regulator [Corynebacterium pygosceleis]
MPDFNPEDKKRILNRLRRARGQLNAVIEAAESGAPCRDVVIQLAALSAALDRAGYAVIAGAMKNCIRDEDSREDGDLTPEELEKLFLMLA